MKTCILKFTTSGFKNLEQKTAVDFYNSSIRKGNRIDLKNRNIKAIFGMNGAGKSAFMYAMYTYCKMNGNSYYLLQESVRKKLDKWMNQKKQEFYFEYIFAIIDDNDETKITEILKHTMVLSPFFTAIGQRQYKVYEKLEKEIGSNINGEYKALYEIKDGEIAICDKSLKYAEYVVKLVDRKLIGSSLISHSFELLHGIEDKKMNEKSILWYIASTYINNITTKVFMDNEDLYEEYYLNDSNLDCLSPQVLIFKEPYEAVKKVSEDLVRKDQLKEYKKDLVKLKEFISILKPGLIDIRPEMKFDGELYHIRKIFVYKDYEIDEEFESTGIKRIIRIYSYLKMACRGEKVFIDEFDANISGVFLDKFVEFFAENGKGQLCFTTHDILSMNVLKKYKHAITTIGESGRVVDIVKNGHYSPMNLFYEGFIEDSPFNIQTFDFLRCFGEED